MVAFDYLKEQLTEFVKTFKNVKVNYEYDQLANLHTIEVLPQVVFDSDEFAIWECDFFGNKAQMRQYQQSEPYQLYQQFFPVPLYAQNQ